MWNAISAGVSECWVTGVDLDALIEVGRMAEEIVGHQLPGELIHAGSVDAFRRQAAA